MNTHDDGGLARDKTLRDEIAIEAIKKMIAGVDLTEDAGSRLAAIVVTQQDGTRATPLLEPIVAEAYELADAIIAEKRTREPKEDAGSLAILRLSPTPRNSLHRNGVRTIADLEKLSDSELLQFRGFGKTSLWQVRRKLAELANAESRRAADTTKYPPA